MKERPFRKERPFYFGRVDLVEQLREEACRRLEENRARIHACAARLNDEQLWHRPNPHVVSVGNLILHLTGNIRQWINSTMGGEQDHRERDKEFDTVGPVHRVHVLAEMDMVLRHAIHVIRAIRDEDFERTWPVQGFHESGTAIVLHVVEHFSYHTGQITLHTKLLRDIDTGYYTGMDLNAKG